MDIQTRLREYTRAIKELRGQTVLCCNEGADRIDELETQLVEVTRLAREVSWQCSVLPIGNNWRRCNPLRTPWLRPDDDCCPQCLLARKLLRLCGETE